MGFFNRSKQDVEFKGLTDKKVEVEKELNLYTREGQFYVLLVEPDTRNRIELERMIDQTGCFVTTVTSGIECMEAASKDKFDLIFIARNMPRMDGVQTMRNLKSSPTSKCRDAKVYVILKEKSDEPDIYFENEGFTGTIRKPVDRTILQNIIINLVPPKMLPDDEELLNSIKEMAASAETLKTFNVRLSEGLKEFGGEYDEYKMKADAFVEDYDTDSAELLDALYSGDTQQYMNLVRHMREKSRKLGAIYLSECFDDHVNMAKDDSLDIAEGNWHKLVINWENVVTGFAKWLGKSDTQLGTTSVLTGTTNGIKLPAKDVKERISEILKFLEENDVDNAKKRLNKLCEYEIDPDDRIKLNRANKSFEREKINTAVEILKTF